MRLGCGPGVGLLEHLVVNVERLALHGGHDDDEDAEGAHYGAENGAFHADDSLGAGQHLDAHPRDAVVVEACLHLPSLMSGLGSEASA